MTRRARVLGSIALVIVAVLAARETGAIDLRWESSRSAATHASQIRGSDVLAASSVRIEYVHDDERHMESIDRASGESIAVTARVARFEVTGSTWTPLVKRAHVEFHVDITSSDTRVSGSVEGTVDRNTRGLMSSHAFRQTLRDGVRELVLKALVP